MAYFDERKPARVHYGRSCVLCATWVPGWSEQLVGIPYPNICRQLTAVTPLQVETTTTGSSDKKRIRRPTTA